MGVVDGLVVDGPVVDGLGVVEGVVWGVGNAWARGGVVVGVWVTAVGAALEAEEWCRLAPMATPAPPARSIATVSRAPVSLRLVLPCAGRWGPPPGGGGGADVVGQGGWGGIGGNDVVRGGSRGGLAGGTCGEVGGLGRLARIEGRHLPFS